MKEYNERDLMAEEGRPARIYSDDQGSLEERMAYARSIFDNKILLDEVRDAAEKFLRDKEQAYFEQCMSGIDNHYQYLQKVKPRYFFKEDSYRHLVEHALSCSPLAITYLDLDSFSEDQYAALCHGCIDMDPLSIAAIKPKKFSDKNKYIKLCELAISKHPGAIEKIESRALSEQQYYDLWELAIEANPSLIHYRSAISNATYYKLCCHAIRKDPSQLALIQFGLLKDGNYELLCHQATDIDPQSIKHVNKKYLANERYYALYDRHIDNHPSIIKYYLTSPYDDKSQYLDLCTRAIASPKHGELDLETVRIILNEALGRKKWDTVNRICDMNTLNKPAEANKEQLLNKATLEGSWNDACAMQKVFQIPHAAGPMRKSFYTYQLEYVTRALLKDSDFSIKTVNEHNIITINEQSYDLTEIMQYANLDHIHLEESDFDLYSNFMASPAYPQADEYQSTLLKAKENAYREKIYQDQSLADPTISFQEMQAINIATAGLSNDLNAMLGGQYHYGNNAKSKAAIIQLVMCASGLSKIPDTALENGYFSPQSPIRNEAVKNNVVKFSELLPISEAEISMPEAISVQLKGAKVKNITALSKEPEQEHYVLPPVQVEMIDYNDLPLQPLFQAVIISDSLDPAPFIVQDPEAMMKAAANNYMPEDAYFDMCRICLKQNPNLLMWVKPENFHTKVPYEQLCSEALSENATTLCMVNEDYVSVERYLEFCNTCLEKIPSLLEHVKPKNFQASAYVAFCQQQIKKFPSVIQYVKEKSITEEAYNELKKEASSAERDFFNDCSARIIENPEHLKEVPPNAFIDKNYYESLCKQATTQRAAAIQYVNPDYISKAAYHQLCAAAIIEAQTKILSEEDYLTIYTTAFIEEPSLLEEIIADNRHDRKFYETLCIQVMSKDPTLVIPFLNKLDEQTINTVFSYAITHSQWLVAKIVCESDLQPKPAMANFSKISSHLTQNGRWKDLYELTQVFHEERYQLTEGPTIKSFYTYQLEHIFRALLKGAKFEVKRVDDEEIIIIDNEATYQLSEILKHAKLDQIELGEDDFSLYSAYLESEEYRNDISPLNGDYTSSLDPTQEKYYRDKLYYYYDQIGLKRPDPPISFQEMQAINFYTGDFYKEINEFLRGQLDLGLNSKMKQKAYRAIIIQSVLCASALQKVPITHIKTSSRAEDLPNNTELSERIKAAAVAKHITTPAFVSTSTNLKDTAFKSKPVIYQFNGLKGVLIRAISKNPTENEFLILPTKIQLTGYNYQDDQHIFQAAVVSDVEDSALDTIKDPKTTLNAPVDHMPEEAYFHMCIACVRQDPSLLKEVKPEKFLNLWRYEAICREAIDKDPSAIADVHVGVSALPEENYFKLCAEYIHKDPLFMAHIKGENFQDKTKYSALCEQALVANKAAVKQYIPSDLDLYEINEINFEAFVSRFKQAFKNTNSGGIKKMITFMESLGDDLDNEKKFHRAGVEIHKIAHKRTHGFHGIVAHSHLLGKGRAEDVGQIYSLLAEKGFSLTTNPAKGCTDYLSALNVQIDIMLAKKPGQDSTSFHTRRYGDNLSRIKESDSRDSSLTEENSSGKPPS